MGDRVRWAFRPDLPGESDEQLTDRARNGDQSAYGELYRRHRKAAESTAWCLLRSKSDADDVVSEAFTGVLSALRNGRGPRDNFRCYLLACVRNGCRVRRIPPVPTNDDELERWSPSMEDPERYIEADTVARAFSSLTPRWQHTLWLTEVEQLPASEVSASLQLSPNATAALTHRARQAFATAYLSEHVAAVSDKECVRAAPLLAGYVRDQLTGPQLATLERHLVNCSHCSAAVAELRDVNASLRSLLPVAPEALAGVALVAETTLVATSMGGATVGLPGAGVLLKGLVAVLLVAPVLSTDMPHNDSRSAQSTENIVEVREAAAASVVGNATPAREVVTPPASERVSSNEPIPSVPETTEDTEPALAPLGGDSGELPATVATVGSTMPVTVTVPTTVLLQPLVDLVDDAVDDVVMPLLDAVNEPLVETLDEALALMGLGSTGETITMLRNLVPLLDGPLLGALLDEILDSTSIVPDPTSGGLGNVPLTLPQTAATASTNPSAGSSSGPVVPAAPLGSSPPTIPAPAVLPGLPAVTLPQVSVPAIVIPPISIPAISIPILDLPPIVLPIISILPVTLPNILG